MKVFRLSRIIALIALIEAPLLTLDPGTANALEILPPPPFEPVPTNPVFPIVKIKYYGPAQELCAGSSGAVTARAACRASERTIDPTALTICARTTGAISLSGPKCSIGSSEVDLRAIRNSSPATWFGVSNVPPLFQTISPIAPPIGPGFPSNPQPLPFPFPTAKVLCKRGSRLSLRDGCLPSESTIHPSALMACVKRSGSVSIQAGACSKHDTRLDLRAVRGPASNPIGIGPLVGLVPSLADLVVEYPN